MCVSSCALCSRTTAKSTWERQPKISSEKKKSTLCTSFSFLSLIAIQWMKVYFVWLIVFARSWHLKEYWLHNLHMWILYILDKFTRSNGMGIFKRSGHEDWGWRRGRWSEWEKEWITLIDGSSNHSNICEYIAMFKEASEIGYCACACTFSDV